MPMKQRTLTTAGKIFGRPVHGRAEYTVQRTVNVAVLTTFEVDADGYLIPGVVFDNAGILIGVAPAYAYGVVVEPIRVALSNSGTDLTAAGTTVQVTLLTIGQVNRKIGEDNMGRVYTANELAGFERAGSKLVLIY